MSESRMIKRFYEKDENNRTWYIYECFCGARYRFLNMYAMKNDAVKHASYEHNRQAVEVKDLDEGTN